MNVAEKLAREIRRVTELREQYARMDGMPNINVKPAMAMMNLALNAACEAAGMNDAEVQIAAVKELESYTE
jgi:hypothetical protein